MWPNQCWRNHCQQLMHLRIVQHNTKTLVESYSCTYVRPACIHLSAVQWRTAACRYTCCSDNFSSLEGDIVPTLWRGSSPVAQGSWGPPAGRRRWRHRLWWRTNPRLQLAAGPRSLDSSSSPRCPPPPPAAWDGPAHCTESTWLSAIAWHEDGF